MVSTFTAVAHPVGQTDRPAVATAMLFADGRLHLHHGPIDLIIGAVGAPVAVNRAFTKAADRFSTILDELVCELNLLRMPLGQTSCQPTGHVAARMWDATVCHVDHYNGADYITLMAAVAGAVADEILQLMCDSTDLDRAYVNNGGDIALFLNSKAAAPQQFSIGICDDPDIVFSSYTSVHAPSGIMPATRPHDFAGKIHVTAADKVGGIATSGWRGRSHSLGIADLVTVLAPTAAAADVAATLIANAVSPDDVASLDCHGVQRQPANTLAPDSDLQSRLVTVSVDTLPDDIITTALQRGANEAKRMCQAGTILAAYGVVQGYGFHCGGIQKNSKH